MTRVYSSFVQNVSEHAEQLADKALSGSINEKAPSASFVYGSESPDHRLAIDYLRSVKNALSSFGADDSWTQGEYLRLQSGPVEPSKDQFDGSSGVEEKHEPEPAQIRPLTKDIVLRLDSQVRGAVLAALRKDLQNWEGSDGKIASSLREKASKILDGLEKKRNDHDGTFFDEALSARKLLDLGTHSAADIETITDGDLEEASKFQKKVFQGLVARELAKNGIDLERLEKSLNCRGAKGLALSISRYIRDTLITRQGNKNVMTKTELQEHAASCANAIETLVNHVLANKPNRQSLKACVKMGQIPAYIDTAKRANAEFNPMWGIADDAYIYAATERDVRYTLDILRNFDSPDKPWSRRAPGLWTLANKAPFPAMDPKTGQ